MGVIRVHKRHSRHVTRTRRWATLRAAVLERDGWQSRRCGERRHLEVDHVLPVRSHPDRAFNPHNLMTLCRACHARKTHAEVGLEPTSPARQAWRDLVRDTRPDNHNPIEETQDA